MSLHRTARALAIVATLLPGCRPFESASSSGEPGAGTAADASGDSPGGGDPPASCKDLLAREPERRGADDLYEIDPDGPGGAAPIRVFCDLTIDRGGWTLVGRSARNARQRPSFGWTSATGSVTDEREPYSLDVARAKLAFTEVLVADQARAHAYKLSVPPDFLTRQAKDAAPIMGLTKVLGDCREDAPTMLRNAGATSLDDGFFFRDNRGTDLRTGLKPDRFDLYYPDCEHGASLHLEQGVIFVR